MSEPRAVFIAFAGIFLQNLVLVLASFFALIGWLLGGAIWLEILRSRKSNNPEIRTDEK